jgi:predicted dehydrogenase
VFCAEALWTFYLPSYDVIRQLLDDGVLGDVRTVLADHGEWFPTPTASCATTWPAGAARPGHLSAGARGVGPRRAEQVVAIGQDVPGGEVHGQVSAVLRHAGGAQSAINTTIMADTPNRAVIAGTGATLVTRRAVLLPRRPDADVGGKKSTIRYTEPAIGHEGCS